MGATLLVRRHDLAEHRLVGADRCDIGIGKDADGVGGGDVGQRWYP